MSRILHEDLVAYALGGLDEQEAARVRAGRERCT